MRMMLLAKLRTVGAAALTALALTTGLGFGLVPAHAGGAKPDDAPKAPTAGAPQPPPAGPVDDTAYLRRACLDLRGTPPTEVESGYFGADRDANKRRKVVDWLLTDDAVKAHLARKLGVPAECVRSVTVNGAVTVVVDVSASMERPGAVAFSPDGKLVTAEVAYFLCPSDAGATGSTVLIRRPTGIAGVTLGRAAVVLDRDRGQPLAALLRIATRQPDPPADRLITFLDEAYDLTVLLADEVLLEEVVKIRLGDDAVAGESDAEFLRKAVQSARGAAPSAVEEKYFAEDKDPKKREKLLDLLLKDPAVAKKLGDDWKNKMLQSQSQKYSVRLLRRPVYEEHVTRVLLADASQQRLEKLVGELVGAKKADEQILDGLTLALLGRLPTASEKLTLAAVGKAADRAAAWVEVAKALAATEEAKKHAAELHKANPAPETPQKK
jgi:hypothetical protein